MRIMKCRIQTPLWREPVSERQLCMLLRIVIRLIRIIDR